MSHSSIRREGLKEAADAVVEFALIAFAEEYLRWDKTVNLSVAQGVWNGTWADTDTEAVWIGGAEPALAELVERLRRARREKWSDAHFRVDDLAVRFEAGEVLFTFDLDWPDQELRQPCEIAVDFTFADPAELG